MGTYNGLLATITQPSIIGVSFFAPVASVPQKFFEHVEFGVAVTGISGKIAVDIIGAVGGATYIVAGRTNISAAGSYPIPLIVYGQSGNDPSVGSPRPYGVNVTSIGTTWSVGCTASVYMAGKY